MNNTNDIERQQRFLAVTDEYKNVIARVCAVYSSSAAPFADLYQEVMINIWMGLENFRGDAKVSTWIYRLALNTCLTWHRRDSRNPVRGARDLNIDIPDIRNDSDANLRHLYELIGMLNPVEKALITLWLDDTPYEEIAVITGFSKANVATRLHRVRNKLSELAKSL